MWQNRFTNKVMYNVNNMFALCIEFLWSMSRCGGQLYGVVAFTHDLICNIGSRLVMVYGVMLGSSIMISFRWEVVL